MKHTKALAVILCAILIGVFLVTPGLALENFMNYKNFNPTVDEDVPVVPDANNCIKQGYINTYVLTADTNKAITVPTGAKYAVFAADANIYVRVGGVAAVPSGDTTDGIGARSL